MRTTRSSPNPNEMTFSFHRIFPRRCESVESSREVYATAQLSVHSIPDKNLSAAVSFKFDLLLVNHLDLLVYTQVVFC
jgi:hypothetical protein